MPPVSKWLYLSYCKSIPPLHPFIEITNFSDDVVSHSNLQHMVPIYCLKIKKYSYHKSSTDEEEEEEEEEDEEEEESSEEEDDEPLKLVVVYKKEKEKEPKKKDISQMSKKERKEFKQKVLCNNYSLIPIVTLYLSMYVCMYVASFI